MEGGLATFQMRDGYSRKDDFLTFDLCTWKEIPELFLVRAFHLSVSRTSTGDGSFLLDGK